MKFLFALFILITTNAFAVDICTFAETFEFHQTLDAKGIKPLKKATNPKRFTFVEKQMIHLTVTLQRSLNGSTKEESLEIFSDLYDGQRGHHAGEILYYEISGKQFALVHYWPGENEYGGFFEIKNNAYKLLAEINDSFIACK